MSQRKKKIKPPVSQDEIDSLRNLHNRRLSEVVGGMSPEHADKIIEAEDNVFTELNGDSRVKGGYQEVNLDEQIGTAIVNPVTEKPETILDKEGDLRNIDGSLHPATESWKKRLK